MNYRKIVQKNPNYAIQNNNKLPTSWYIIENWRFSKNSCKGLLYPQGRIQTTSTYASAEVTSAVVKLLKKYRNTRFLLQIILFFSSADRKDWNVFGQGMPWLFCKICRMSLYACHAVKTVLKIPWLCHMFLFQMPARIQQNTRAEQITDYVVRQLF